MVSDKPATDGVAVVALRLVDQHYKRLAEASGDAEWRLRLAELAAAAFRSGADAVNSVAERRAERLESADFGMEVDLQAGDRDSQHGTRLWLVSLDGYYDVSVSARTAVEAVMLAAVGDHLDGAPDDVEISVRPYTEERARAGSFHDQETGATTSIWDEWKSDPRARVVGCSEW